MGTERCYYALRVAHALLKQESAEVSLFLMADAIAGRTEGSFFELIAP